MGLPRAWFAFRRAGCAQLHSLTGSFLGSSTFLVFPLTPNHHHHHLCLLGQCGLFNLPICFGLASVVDRRQVLEQVSPCLPGQIKAKAE